MNCEWTFIKDGLGFAYTTSCGHELRPYFMLDFTDNKCDYCGKEITLKEAV
jgi:hypothetical protein